MTKTFKSRLLGVLISSLVLLTGFFGVSLGLGDTAKVAFAATTCTYENGFCTTHTSSDDCYYEACTQNSDGYYEIANGGNMFWFAKQVNAGNVSIKGKIVVDEIDLENRNWSPIASYTSPFTGIFDGNGATIKNFYREVSLIREGLFAASRNATIGNFSIEGNIKHAVAINENHTGTICGECVYTTLENIVSSVNIETSVNNSSVKTKPRIGGIVGCASEGANLSKCIYTGEMISGETFVYEQFGGIIGYVFHSGVVSVNNCAFYGKINCKNTTASMTIAGLVQYANNGQFTISNCLSAGELSTAGSNVSICSIGYFNGNLNGASYASNLYYTKIDGDSIVISGTTSVKDVAINASTEVTDEQIKSGEVAYLLNDGVTDGTQVWYIELTITVNSNWEDGKNKSEIMSEINDKQYDFSFSVSFEGVFVNDVLCSEEEYSLSISYYRL